MLIYNSEARRKFGGRTKLKFDEGQNNKIIFKYHWHFIHIDRNMLRAFITHCFYLDIYLIKKIIQEVTQSRIKFHLTVL